MVDVTWMARQCTVRLKSIFRLLSCVCLPMALWCVPVTGAAGAKLGPEKKTEFGVGLRTGSGFLNFQGTCVTLQVYHISDKFFSGLRVLKTPDGTEFKKDGTLFRTFPEHLIVDVHVAIFKCPVRPDQMELPSYGEGFMSETSFQLGWKGAFGDLRPVSQLSTHEQHQRPSLQWDYFLELPAKDVPLTDSLLIDISFHRGAAHAHLSGSLAQISAHS